MTGKSEIKIKLEIPLEELLDGVSVEEYEKSVKNGLVLTSPNLHPPDVNVEVSRVEEVDDA